MFVWCFLIFCSVSSIGYSNSIPSNQPMEPLFHDEVDCRCLLHIILDCLLCVWSIVEKGFQCCHGFLSVVMHVFVSIEIYLLLVILVESKTCICLCFVYCEESKIVWLSSHVSWLFRTIRICSDLINCVCKKWIHNEVMSSESPPLSQAHEVTNKMKMAKCR